MADNHSCEACNGTDTSQMVACDKCGSWWHFDCVDVGESICEKDFLCRKCIFDGMEKEATRTKPLRSANSNAGGSVASRQSKINLRLQKLEEQKALMERKLELERAEQRRRHEVEKLLKDTEIEKKQLEMEMDFLEEKFRVLEKDCEDDGDDNVSRGSAQSSISKVNRWREQLLGGVVNSTMAIPETVSVPVTTSTTAVRKSPQTAIPSNIHEIPTTSELGNIPVSATPTMTATCNANVEVGNRRHKPMQATTTNQGSISVPAPIQTAEPPIGTVRTAQSSNPQGCSGNVVKNVGSILNEIPQSYLIDNVQVGGERDRRRCDDRHYLLGRQGLAGANSLQNHIPPSYAGMHGSSSRYYFSPTQTHSFHHGTQNQYTSVAPGPSNTFLPQSYPQPSSHLSPTNSPMNRTGPAPDQLAARHVMPKELPPFSGNPEDWPLFISSFNNSTDACGFTNAENLMRLQRCLRGPALEAVRSRLLLPNSVPQVIATLHTLYGRPEILVYALLKKVREVPAPKPERLETLVGFGMAVQNLCDHLQAGEQEAHLNNPTLLFELVEKLPSNLKLDWAMVKRQQPGANLRTFASYMSTIVSAVTEVTLTVDTRTYSQKHDRAKEKNYCNPHSSEMAKPDGPSTLVERNFTVKQCLVCKDPQHKVRDCASFQKLPVDDRWKLVQKLSLCRICLFSHGRRPCKSKDRCQIDGCEYRHHPLLHSSTSTKRPSTSNNTAVQNHHRVGQGSLFRIIPVTLYGQGRSITTFAFLDDGSSVTLIENSLTDALGVDGRSSNLCLTWTSDVSRCEQDSKQVSLQISGSQQGQKFTITKACTVKNLGLPQQSLCYEDLKRAYPYLRDIQIQDYVDAVPRILIGNDNAHLAVTLKRREGRQGEPIATKTRLGWSVHGPTLSTKNGDVNLHICQCTQEGENLHELVKQYFSLENMGVSIHRIPESEEELRAKRILHNTTKRIGLRFEIGLLWKFNTFEFPDSFFMAVKRLECLERRMKADPALGAAVWKQIDDYENKGYIAKASEEDLHAVDPRKVWYLPLGVTINPKKPGKIRIFCDAAAKVDGVSLNTMLIKGPDLLVPLKTVIVGFRERQVAICADVKEMFHQMIMRKADRQAQRVLLRRDPNQEPEVYFMNVATFGSASSPCSAQYVKNRNANDHAERYPDAAEAIIRKHYVDDYLDSLDDEEEAIKRAREVTYVHSRGGFVIRGWMSNSEKVLRKLGESESAEVKEFANEVSGGSERILGVLWKPREDMFAYSAEFVAIPEWPTKRMLLRTVMSLYDPLGFVSHFTIHGKILIQDVWRSKVMWDEKIPEILKQRWEQWVFLFPALETVRVPRCYFPGQLSIRVSEIQLHVFVDASLAAFACVAYLRAEVAGQIQCSLVAAKSKVAPLKLTSVPRLELQAAVLGARLVEDICTTHTLPIRKRFIWTDSKTVMGWIRSDQRKYRQYVGFRIGEILEKTKCNEWNWIPSNLNVADDATKWKGEICLKPDSRWFRGPDFLYSDVEHWPLSTNANFDTDEEQCAKWVMEHHVSQSAFEWERFSQWRRLIRAVGYVVRFLGNLKAKVRNSTTTQGPLKQHELEIAESCVFRAIQKEFYPKEVAILQDPAKTRTHLERDSKLFKLCPFRDVNGIMRMESRISQAAFASYDTRNPIILPRGHYVTNLVVMWYHCKFLHGNKETVVNEMRQRFHISNLRTVVRQVARECSWCKVIKSVPKVPRMSPLPPARLGAFFRPFSFVGVDYFGPITIRVLRSSVKRWVALFTCLSIRAVHLEVVHSLSTESCKMAVRRFVARRGSPSEIYSDNATNFCGASNDLRNESKIINTNLAETFTNAHTKWLFIPPSSPHMGGAWERMVRSIKTAFYAISTTKLPTEEIFATILAEAEGIVNSRPLTFIPLDEDNQEALTPNHFLLMSSNGVVQPSKMIHDTEAVCRSDWDFCRRMVDLFWRRWVIEYIPTITRRTKWFGETKPVKQGDSVIIIDEKNRNGWVRGRVLEIRAGRDGRVRKAWVQTATGVLLRPVAKLAVLDLDPGKTGQV